MGGFYLLGLGLLGLGFFLVAAGFSMKNPVLFFFKIFSFGVKPSLGFFMLLDHISFTFLGVLLMISGSVFVFSDFYMAGDPFYHRFFYSLFLFVLSMVFLILFPSFFWVLLGWDGLGVTSFILMVYYSAKSSLSAGMKTYLINRLGDGFFLASIGFFLVKGSFFPSSGSFWFLLFLIFALFTKSANFPFSSWLPEAMAAPTPVSSLVHSSTLVTAGLYILMRLYDFFPQIFLLMIGLLGFWTLLFSSLSALLENDSKKVVAYSTLSQLGFMSVALFLGNPYLAFFHLLSHAMFKSLIFILVGRFLLKNSHSQDLRSFNTPFNIFPFDSLMLFFSCMSLFGFFFLSGNFSKESLMEKKFFSYNFLFWVLFSLSLFFTGVYSFRLFFLFFKKFSFSDSSKIFSEGFFLSFFYMVPLSIMVFVFGFVYCSSFSPLIWGELEYKFFLNLVILFPFFIFIGGGFFNSPSFLLFSSLFFTAFFNSPIFLKMSRYFFSSLKLGEFVFFEFLLIRRFFFSDSSFFSFSFFEKMFSFSASKVVVFLLFFSSIFIFF